MNYKQNYLDYINYVKTLNRQKGQGIYYETHHIIPKSLGGNNSKSNLVLLTAREHFLAHYLLCKITENNKDAHYKMICAMNLLLSFKNTDTSQLRERTNAYTRCSRYYARIKEKYAKELSLAKQGTSSSAKGKKVPKSELKYWIYNPITKDCKMVLLELIPDYEKNGWIRGRGHVTRKKSTARGLKTTIYNPTTDIELRILKKDIKEYLDKGFIVGRRPVSEETRQKHKAIMLDPDGKHQKYFDKIRSGEISRKGREHTKAIHKNDKYIVINESELQQYLSDGWELGGKPKSQEWKNKMSKAMIGNKNGCKKKEAIHGEDRSE